MFIWDEYKNNYIIAPLFKRIIGAIMSILPICSISLCNNSKIYENE